MHIEFHINKNFKYYFTVLLCGAVSAVSFYCNYSWFLIFLSLSSFIYIVLKYYSKLLTFIFIYSLSYQFFCNIWLLKTGSYIIRNKILAIGVSVLMLLVISLLLSLLFSFPFLIYRPKVCKRKSAIICTLPFIYIFGEWLQGIFRPFAYPWARLCNIVAADYLFIQSASVLGGLFISLLIVFICTLTAYSFLNRQNLKKYLVFAGAFLYILNIFYGYKEIKSLNIHESEATEILLIQPDIAKTEKWSMKPEDGIAKYIQLTKNNISSNTKIVFFPETALSSKIFSDKNFGKELYETARRNNITIVLGAQYNCNDKKYNAAVAIYPDSCCSEVYMKQVLVPFGEYAPFSLFGKHQFISQPFSKGEKNILIKTEYGDIGCGICFESAFPEIISENTQLGADVIAILTNDSWLGNSIPLYQHHSHSVLRAVENRKYVINCANTGISSVISPYGNIISSLETNQENTLHSFFKSNNIKTTYSHYGDIIIIPSCIIIFVFSVKIIAIRIKEIRTAFK